MSAAHQTSPRPSLTAQVGALQAQLDNMTAERDELRADRDRLDEALQGMWRMWQERLTEQEQDEVTERAMDAMRQSGRLV